MSLSREPGVRQSTSSYRYLISGLVVHSEVELPSAIALTGESALPDVVIRAGSVPERLESPLHSTEIWDTEAGLFLLRLRGIGRFSMNRGCEILFDRERDCEPRALALVLLGTCFAILLQQRGHLVLHASAVAAQGGAMLFCGPSGAGKSTLAAMLCRRG
jgi:ABC-type multidrug transport system fused ATPase/permease subunit